MAKLTPEHQLLCDTAAMVAHLDKYSRTEQRKLLNRVTDHLRKVVEAQRPTAHERDRDEALDSIGWFG